MLCLDVDGTLVKWENLAEDGIVYEDGRPNVQLRRAVERYLEEHPETVLVVWSGGGDWYAALLGRRVLGHEDFTALEKIGALRAGAVGPGDVVVDDERLGENLLRGARLLTAEAFAAEVLGGV